MARFPFRPELSSGEVGAGPPRAFVRDAFAFGSPEEELRRRQDKAASYRAALDSWVGPFARGALSALNAPPAAVLAGYEVLRNEAAAYEDRGIRGAEAADLGLGAVRLPPEGESVAGELDWSSVGDVVNTWRDNPGSISMTTVMPGLAGLVADIALPGGFDFLRAGKVAREVVDGIGLLLSRWEGVAPGLTAFLLPLRNSFAKGSSSDRLAAIVDQAADKFLEPQDADAFRSEFRDLVFRRAESESTGIYPRDAGSYGQVARDQIARVLTPEVFDRSVPGMSNVETSLGSPWGIQFSVWDSDPEIRKDYEDFRWDAVRKDRARDYLDALVTAVSDYELPNLFGNTGRSRVNVMGTNATRNYDVSTQGLDDSSRKALARYTGTGNISSIQPLSQATIENVNDLFDGNVYNAINSFLRGDGNSLSWIANPKDMERFAREVQDIDRAFASASLPASTVVYRGAFLDTDNPIGIDIASLMEQSRLDPNFTWENAANALRGQVVMDRGFSSFTERPSHAYTFIRQKANAQDTGQDRIGVLYQMQLPEGSPAIPLYGYGNNNVDNKIGAFPTEQEILLPREVPMRIVDAQFQFPLDVGQGSQGRQVHHLDPSNEIKPYLVVLVEPDFSGVR